MDINRTIQVTNRGFSPILSIAQGTDMVRFNFRLTDFDVPSGSAAVAYNIQPTGNIVPKTCSISGNTISVDPPAYYFLRGKNYMQIQITNNGKRLVTFLIEVWCSPNIATPEVVEMGDSTVTQQLLSEVGLLSARINNLAKLQEGSTTGDAELRDIRIGYDGTEYENAGEAVRGQIGSLSEDLDDYSEKIIGINNLFPYPYLSKNKISNGISFETNGRTLKIQGETTGIATFQFFGAYGATDNNTLEKGKTYYVSGIDIYTKLVFFNESGKEVLIIAGETEKTIKFVVPTNASGANFYWQCVNIGTPINVIIKPEIYITDISVVKQLNDKSFSKNTIEKTDLVIDSYYEPMHNIIDVPNNRITRVANNLSDYKKFGLPRIGFGTLLKYRPFDTEDKTTGYTVYDYTVLENNNIYSRWYAYAIDNQTADNLQWEKIPTFNDIYNKGIKELGSKPLSIVFIGDSIVEGYGCSNYNGGTTGTSGHLISNNVKTWYRNTGDKCWANKMINYLIETYPNIKACNNAIGGFTTSQVYNNLNTLTLDDDGDRANVVILSVGTNDRYAKDKKVAISNYIIKIIEWLRSRQIQPIVLTNTPFLNGEKGNNPESVHRAIIDGCESAYCTCYPLLPTLKRYIWEHNISIEASSDQTKLLYDYLHPSDILYNIMFEIIKEILLI